jgi:hypothetical protein
MKTGNKILFVLCAIAIAAGVIIYFEASAFQKKAKAIFGTVVNAGLSTYEIKFITEDGVEKTYHGNHGGKGRRFHDGERMRVFYMAGDPEKMRISDGVKNGKGVVKVGIVMLLFNILSVYFDRKRTRSQNTFKTTGRKVEAQIVRIDTDMTLTIMKKNPYYIDCKWVDPITGREYNHTVRYIWEDPKTLLKGRSSIDVYMDRNDPEKYFMDVEFLGAAAK